MLQNLNAVQVAGIIFFVLNLAIRVGSVVLPPSITRIHNYPEFNVSNWACLLVTPLFILAGHYLIKHYHTHYAASIALVYVVAFCMYLTACGMVFSFIATYDPSNSIIIYLVALIAVASVYTFEYQETLLLTILNAVTFTLLLLYVRADPTEIIYNELMMIVLMGIFFFVARHIYSYRASNYLQVRIITEKNAEIEKASSFKNDVLGMVAHDLRNPIGAVESIAMLMEMEAVDEDTQENIGMIKTSCHKALAIINDLLEVARNDNSNELVTETVDLNQFLKEIIQVWKLVNDFNYNLVLHIPNQPVKARVNAEKLQRVLDNLISNAAKFSKAQGTIEINARAEQLYTVIEVRDYGLGIPKAMLPHIFDRFSKAGRKGLKGEQSTGLGLSISKQIVEKHNGKITVDSEEGKGSVFTIRLPLAKPSL